MYSSVFGVGDFKYATQNFKGAKGVAMATKFGHCSISLKFRTDFDHVTLDVPRTFKINGSKVKLIM